ncbi:MAG: hypothetical protein SF339_13915 [Blastocatellia bacterium]|nr:hypothetical protein [Blastocatellia bacterium]
MTTLALSLEKLRALQPELFAPRSWTKFLRENGYRLGALNEDVEFWKRQFAEHLRGGVAEAAVVASAAPLLIAAYAGELDCIAMLRFEGRFAQRNPLRVGTRLLSSTNYLEWNFWLPEDLRPGPRASGKYRNFAPLIADFLTEDAGSVERLKTEIPERLWKRVESLGREYLAANGEKARDGRPLLCHLPAKK